MTNSIKQLLHSKGMRTLAFSLLLGIISAGCDDENVQPKPPSTSPNKIMALGASR